MTVKPGVHYIGRGQDAECKLSKSAFIQQLLRIFLKDSVHCLYHSYTLPGVSALSGEGKMSASKFWYRSKLDAEINFLTPSATCLHCRADIVRTSRLSVTLPPLPKTLLKASAVRGALRRQAEATRNVSGKRGADADLYSASQKKVYPF